MAQGTNTEILGKGSKNRERKSNAGRPAVDRELVLRNMQLKDSLGIRRYTDTQLAKMAKCGARTIRRIRDEAIEAGIISADDTATKGMGIVEADFDAETQRVMGYTFSSWLKDAFSGSIKTTAQTYFNFTSKVWEQVWDKCSLVEMADRSSQLADINARKYVSLFNDDPKRMRGRLKRIRFIFRFLGRQDVCDRHLKMSNSKHPRSKRRVPEITAIGFGKLWQEVEDAVVSELGEEARLMMRFKICTQMRTGDKNREKEFYGLRKGTNSRSYISMPSVEHYQAHIFAKKGEEWNIIWMPLWVKEHMKAHLDHVEEGETLWGISVSKFRSAVGRHTKRILGRKLILHDLRKISLTWFYTMGIPIEVATMLNVGWKDLNTAHDHYLDIKSVIRQSYRAEYRENIPAWFKEGLDDFIGFEAVINPQQNTALGNIQGVSHFG